MVMGIYWVTFLKNYPLESDGTRIVFFDIRSFKLSRGGFRGGAGRFQALQINLLLSSLSAFQSLPRLIPKKHSEHSLMWPETVVQMSLESQPPTPYYTTPMASQRLKKKQR